ncbi:hypothetical protein FRB91_009685 [Serendipita sp. 411]|nr:hypothetical protein FRC18_004449 [Serendipita sp. 400]KAG8849682.1 hypothetical protein FRB91_009685 [Serendipita sp. 411]
MATQTEFVLPERYTFSKYGQPMSKTALDMIENLMKEANNCDPDAHDMYICNDYLGYAVFNIVNRVIDSIYRKAAKKQWIESWDTLTALAIFIDTFPDFMNIDDGELVIAADKVFGALVVKVLKALAPEFAEKGESEFPDLESCLRQMANVGENSSGFDGGQYTQIIKNYARHLFGRRTEEEREARAERIKRAYQKFYKALPKDEKKEFADPSAPKGKEDEDKGDEDEEDGWEDEEDEEDEKDAGPWFGKPKAQDVNYKIQSFPLDRAWKTYRELRAGGGYSPPVWSRGEPVWDLTKWSAADKKRYLFENMDDI